MQFVNPTTQEEMYEVLQTLFYYYRIRRENGEDVTYSPLAITRMQYVPPTQQQIRALAERAVLPSQTETLMKYVSTLTEQSSVAAAKATALASAKTAEIAAINGAYAEAEQKVYFEAIKRGIAESSAVTDRVAALTLEKTEKINAVTDKFDADIAEQNAIVTLKQSQITNAQTAYSALFESQIQAKIDEITAKEQEKADAVFKYNNSVAERELRYGNTLLTNARELTLKMLSITKLEFSKDQLVEMGYYDDVIRCVRAYYDTLSPLAAYQGVSHDDKLIMYLDDYYPNVVYMYKLLAT